MKASESEPLMTCRKNEDGIETRAAVWPWDEPGGHLLTAQVVPGMKAARAWSGLPCGTWERVAPMHRRAGGGRPGQGDPQAADTVRGRVPMRGTRAGRLAVVMKPGNSGGAKGTGHPGSLGGQPGRPGGAR
jgi:hypothetical protein